jgi:hypothetical protein
MFAPGVMSARPARFPNVRARRHECAPLALSGDRLHDRRRMIRFNLSGYPTTTL